MANEVKVSDLTVRIAQEDRYRFHISFDKAFTPIMADEPPPLGQDSGPNAARLLASAIGNCLAASLVFCLSKKGVAIAHGIKANVTMEIVRNSERRLRIGPVQVTLQIPEDVPAESLEQCRDLFEDFCTVTASVRHGITIDVSLEHATKSNASA